MDLCTFQFCASNQFCSKLNLIQQTKLFTGKVNDTEQTFTDTKPKCLLTFA
jgi:hypothetical protein